MTHNLLFQRRLIFAAALFVLLVGAACTTDNGPIETVTGSGNVTTETREVSGFSRIEMSSGGEIVVRVGDAESLTISAEDNFMPLIKTEVRSGWLVISHEQNKSLSPTRPLVYTITVPRLQEVKVNGGGPVTATGIDEDSFAVTVSGSSNFTLTGTAQTQSYSINGSGFVNATELTGTRATVTITGMGNVDVNVSDSLDVTISGSGTVTYAGSPDVTENITGQGQVVAR
ncbi:MAG: DUF2807 domain-containing protein [Chloroflexi bacterium]|nr:DUF2807 domain-containing protein [Chloroflexota bacterium]